MKCRTRSGRELTLDEAMFASEDLTGNRNRAIGYKQHVLGIGDRGAPDAPISAATWTIEIVTPSAWTSFSTRRVGTPKQVRGRHDGHQGPFGAGALPEQPVREVRPGLRSP